MRTYLLVALLLVTTSVVGQRRVAYRSLEATYVALNAADVVTTYRAINRGGYEENPLLRPIISRPAVFIPVKGLMTLGSLALLRRIGRDSPKAALVYLSILNIGMGAVVYHNYRVTLRIPLGR